MKNIPKKIYLVLGNKKPSKIESFNDLTEVSLCRDKIDKWDLEYISKNEVDKMIKEYANKEKEKIIEFINEALLRYGCIPALNDAFGMEWLIKIKEFIKSTMEN